MLLISLSAIIVCGFSFPGKILRYVSNSMSGMQSQQHNALKCSLDNSLFCLKGTLVYLLLKKIELKTNRKITELCYVNKAKYSILNVVD